MSDIDFQIVDVEMELEKRRNEQYDLDGCGGCLQFFLLMFVGLLILAVFTVFLSQK